jgi:two-component system sensor histidine kinase DesK
VTRGGSSAGLSVGQGVWWFFYEATQFALGVCALYGSARLIVLMGELDLARDEYVRDAVQTERRRAWRDLHDVLGQTLVAISLKTDLARRLLSRAPDRSREELDELIGLAEKADELAVIARGERVFVFEAELSSAVRLLEAAGIEVSSEIDVDELDKATSALLGLAVREATTNILRHARAQQVWIHAGTRSDRLVLEIGNDGASGGDAVPGTGLRSLAERAGAADGMATASLQRDGMFVLEVSVPVWARV